MAPPTKPENPFRDMSTRSWGEADVKADLIAAWEKGWRAHEDFLVEYGRYLVSGEWREDQQEVTRRATELP